MKEVYISSSVETIKFNAFSGCCSLEHVLFDSNSNLTTIDFYAFENCSSLQEIEIPPSVQSIKRFAFKDCKSLKNIVINPSIKIIQPYAFDGCISLNFSSIPEQYNKIHKFESEANIKTVFLGSSGVGKASISKRYVDGQFYDCGAPIIGTEYSSKLINIDGIKTKIQLWVTAGQERFRQVIKPYCRNSHCAIIVFDLTDEQSIKEAIYYYVDFITELNGILPIVFLGNKSDLKHNEINEVYLAKLKELEKSIK